MASDARRTRCPPAAWPGKPDSLTGRNAARALELVCVAKLFAELRDDERGQRVGLITRRAVMTLFAVIVLVALLGVFGQRATSSTATGPAVTLRLEAPETVRGGLFFQSRIDVTATRTVGQPRLVFDEGWLEGMQVNSIEPAAESESSRDGRLVLSYGALGPGDRLRIYMQFEVNPTNVGRRSYGFELDDGQARIARIDRDITVLP